MASDQPNIYTLVERMLNSSQTIAFELVKFNVSFNQLLEMLKPQIVGITTIPSTPMESKMKVALVKKSAQKAAAAPKAAVGHAAIVDFQLQDNEDSTCTVLGVDAAGNTLDISSLATLTPPPTSSDTTILTVDPPTGMTFKMHAAGKLSTPGTPVNIIATATFTAGGIGPFTFTLPCDVVAGPVTGVLIVPGTPTVH